MKKCGGRVKNRRGGAPGGARGLPEARGASHEASDLLPKRLSGAPLPRAARGKKKEAPPRASLTIGVDGARPYGGTAAHPCAPRRDHLKCAANAATGETHVLGRQIQPAQSTRRPAPDLR